MRTRELDRALSLRPARRRRYVRAYVSSSVRCEYNVARRPILELRAVLRYKSCVWRMSFNIGVRSALVWLPRAARLRMACV